MNDIKMLFPLSVLPVGEKGRVTLLSSVGGERRRLLDLGLVEGTTVEAVQKSPFGNPVAYFIRGTVIALRIEDACKIFVEALV